MANLSDLYTALAAARLEFGSVVKSKTAKAGTYSYDYADLAGVIEATAGALARHGICVFQAPEISDKSVIIHTTLVHASGASLTFPPLPMPIAQNTPQGIGSAITYCRRYALTSILNVAAEDDDAQAAVGTVAKGDTDAPGTPQARATSQRPANAPSARPGPSTLATTQAETNGDALFMQDAAQTEPTTDEEDALISGWAKFGDAYDWAVTLGACANNFEAKTSLNKILQAYGGYSKETRLPIMTAFIRRQREKLAQAQPA